MYRKMMTRTLLSVFLLPALVACNNAPAEVASPEPHRIPSSAEPATVATQHPTAVASTVSGASLAPSALASPEGDGPAADVPVGIKRAILAITGMR